MTRATCRGLVAAASCLATLAAAGELGEPAAFPSGVGLRVESTLFAGDKPVARSLTLFRDGVAWDFLELPALSSSPLAKAQGMQLAEIVLHDPARERVVVIDPVRHLKTEIPRVRLERLGVSLATWARTSDDRLIRWAGGPDFGTGFREHDDRLELAGPRVRYVVRHAAASSPEEAASYRQFADTAILLKGLLQPGGIPPFPRLAINRRLEEAGAIPTEVILEIEPRGVSLGGPATKLKGEHRSHPRILAEDLERIEEAEAQLAAAEPVELAEFAAAHASPRP